MFTWYWPGSGRSVLNYLLPTWQLLKLKLEASFSRSEKTKSQGGKKHPFDEQFRHGLQVIRNTKGCLQLKLKCYF